MSGWQPIETAPKDGTAILVYFPKDFFDRKRNHQTVVYWAIKDPWVTGWEVYGGSFLSIEPTHWMPLPDPPPTPAAGGGEMKTEDKRDG